MKILERSNSTRILEGSPAARKEYRGPGRPMPPHERRALLRVEFEESDWTALEEIFGDKDTAFAAAEIVQEAPPEIQVLAIQLMDMKLKSSLEAGSMVTSKTRWTSPVLGQEAEELYGKLYGESGGQFLRVLETSPYEMAVISRMIAHLKGKKEVS